MCNLSLLACSAALLASLHACGGSDEPVADLRFNVAVVGDSPDANAAVACSGASAAPVAATVGATDSWNNNPAANAANGSSAFGPISWARVVPRVSSRA